MTCAYTSKTSGLLGNIKYMTLEEAFIRKYRLEGEFYTKFGNSPCLIRNNYFKIYLDTLENDLFQMSKK